LDQAFASFSSLASTPRSHGDQLTTLFTCQRTRWFLSFSSRFEQPHRPLNQPH